MNASLVKPGYWIMQNYIIKGLTTIRELAKHSRITAHRLSDIIMNGEEISVGEACLLGVSLNIDPAMLLDMQSEYLISLEMNHKNRTLFSYLKPMKLREINNEK